MKRVCFLFNHDYVAHTRVMRQVETLLGMGYDVTIFCLAENADRPLAEDNGRLHIRRVLKKRLYKYHMFSLRALKVWAKIVRGYPRFDVVHVIDAPMLWLGWLLSRFWRSRLVYDAAELWDALFDEERERLLANASLSEGERRKKLKQLEKSREFEGWVLSRCDGVLTVNDSIGELLQKKAGRPIPRLILIRNIARYRDIAGSRRLREHFNLSDDVKVMVYQGQIAEKRGLGRAVEAMAHLADENIVLILIGPVLPADAPYFETVQQRIAGSDSLRNKIFYRGFLPPDELLDWTASADLGLQPIINWNMNHYLCLPNKIFEYIQAGLPIAASDFPEMRRVIEGYGIGFLFNPDDPKQMAKEIRKYFSDPDRQARYRQNLQAAKRDLNWENEEKRLIALYHAIAPMPVPAAGMSS